MWNLVPSRVDRGNHVEIGPVFGPNHASCHLGPAANHPTTFRNPLIARPGNNKNNNEFSAGHALRKQYV